MKILIVEDSAPLRMAMSSFVADAGHEPLIAQSGEQALEMFELTQIDMVIMDVKLTGLNGFETARLIREWLGEHWIPIIFVSGTTGDGSYKEGIDAGGDDYLIKPVSYVIIEAKIRAMERIISMRDQLRKLNADLETLSQIDSLTQIYNRRTFNELANQQWSLVKRHQQPISALMIDVDHFKLFNDHYGHPAGDGCLQKVALAIKDALSRSGDLIGRYGGEEFIVLLPDTDASGSLLVAERIRLSISELRLPHAASPTSSYVTVSIGGAVCPKAASHSIDELVKSADRALYSVKRNGRNHVVVEEIVTHKTLLIANPDPVRAQELNELLHTEFNIIHSDSAQDCLDTLLQVRPDIVLIDETLAAPDDYRLCHTMNALPFMRAVPLIITNASEVFDLANTEGINYAFDKSAEKVVILDKLREFAV